VVLPKSGVARAVSPVFGRCVDGRKGITRYSTLVMPCSRLVRKLLAPKVPTSTAEFPFERKRLSIGCVAAVVQLRSDPAPGKQTVSIRDARRGQWVKLPCESFTRKLLGSHSRRPLTGHCAERAAPPRAAFAPSRRQEHLRLPRRHPKHWDSWFHKVLLATTKPKGYHRFCLVNRPWVPSVV
jgi:hypothetical protein